MHYEHQVVQRAAKKVLEELVDIIGPESTECSIASFATKRLSELGFSETWYHSCPSLVLAGNRSCLSISGREYTPNNEPFGSENLITVDLSPCAGSTWGDCARSLAIEDGAVSNYPTSTQFRCGFDAETQLHEAMRNYVTPSTSFHEMHEFVNVSVHFPPLFPARGSKTKLLPRSTTRGLLDADSP